jgi:hypothetical protein
VVKKKKKKKKNLAAISISHGTPLLNFHGPAQRRHASSNLSRADPRFLRLCTSFSTSVALSKSGFKQHFPRHSRSFSADKVFLQTGLEEFPST